jgi:hypothetical protein
MLQMLGRAKDEPKLCNKDRNAEEILDKALFTLA